MIRFKSIISRIVILHVIAVTVTSVVMSLALSWLLSLATNNIHNEAMEAQANSVARYLVLNADGVATVELPPELQGLYSQPYGRYSYAVIDEHGRVVISSLKDRTALFSNDPRSANVEFLEMRRGSAAISGASIQKALMGRPYRIQAGEDLANRDVIIDDIVSDFFRNVGWVTLPILVVLLGIDIAIFRRALRPLREAELGVVLQATLDGGSLPDLKTLIERFRPKGTALPVVIVTLPSLAIYDQIAASVGEAA